MTTEFTPSGPPPDEDQSSAELLVLREGQRVDPPPRRPVDRIMDPVHAFARHNLAGAGLLMGGAMLAVGLANSPWAEAWAHLLQLPIELSIGDYELGKSLLHWINDGLMGVFFFVVGLEIKREVKVGQLSTLRKAGLPVIAAVGGMLLPVAVYYALTVGGEGAEGWGIPMATDIAFALGVLALLGDRVPTGLKVFLTALAIVDDIGAVSVIALFYTDTVALMSLLAAAVLLIASYGLNRLRVRSTIAYLVLGLGAWLAFVQSGVHATIAALLMAFTIPARTWLDGAGFQTNIKGYLAKLHEVGLPEDRSLNSVEQQRLLENMATTVNRASAPLSKLEHGLAPLVTFLVLPIFALANAGVSVSGTGDALGSPVTLGVMAGLLVGKPVGVISFTWIAVKSGWVDLPDGVDLRHVIGVGLLAGIGFTMALFVGGLAFVTGPYIDQAKIGVMAASVISGSLGYLWLRFACPNDAQGALA